MAKDEGSEIVAELRSIKLLLILQLLKSGSRQAELASLLGVSDATMSRMLPKGAKPSKTKTQNLEE